MTIDKDKYKQLFSEEAAEYLQILNASLLEFEKNPTNTMLAEKMMRAAHTLKGIAASMGYQEIEKLAHQTEDLFEGLRKGKGLQKATPELIQNCFNNVDVLEKAVKAKTIKSSSDGEPQTEVEGITLAQQPEALEPVTTVKVRVEKLDALMNLTEELLVNRMRLGQINEKLKMKNEKLQRELNTAVIQLDRLVSDLQYTVMQARLVPVEQIFNRFPRMVRDLAKKEGKEVEFEISGSEIELDRTLINQIGEPLVHLLRNAVDHGIENSGIITLSAKREKGIAVICVEDNGKGIDWDKIGSQEKLFSGVSTAKKVTQVSGRGVGLKVVKEKVEQVGGTVKVESPINEKGGTKFTLALPLTLAIAQALLVKVGPERFAIPVADVERLVRLQHDQIKKTADMEAAVIAEEDVPLVRLSNLFSNIVGDKQDGKSTILAVLAKIPATTAGRRNQTVGFVVDEVLSEQDIIIKPLTGILREEKGLSGATILGDGSVVLILDITSLVELVNYTSREEVNKHG